MIAVVQNNAINAEDLLQLKHKLKKHNISIKFFPNQVMPSFSDDYHCCELLLCDILFVFLCR